MPESQARTVTVEMDPSPLIHTDEGRRPMSTEAIESVVCWIVEQ
jgi:hypothetical protein